MKILSLLLSFLLFSTLSCSAQYQFKTVKEAGCTPVKNQSRTGAYWSFATCSFLESEMMRMGKGEMDLSEMFVVRNIYKDKAYNYVMRQGAAAFSEGSLGHDLIRTVARYGIVPESVYSGLIDGEQFHDHGEMEAVLQGALDGLIKRRDISEKWKQGVDGLLTAYIGHYPGTFESYATTDDHLMHIVGIVKDQHGTKYYKVKNSWGERGKLAGYLYLSAAYFRLKTVAIMVNKNSAPGDIARKMKL